MSKLKSRKLIIGVVYSALVIINDLYGSPVSQDAVFVVAGLLGACIIGLGIADAGAAKAAIVGGEQVAAGVTNVMNAVKQFLGDDDAGEK